MRWQTEQLLLVAVFLALIVKYYFLFLYSYSCSIMDLDMVEDINSPA